MNKNEVYNVLLKGLSNGDAAFRIKWAEFCVEHQIKFQELFPLMNQDTRTAKRFMSFVSDCACIDSNYIYTILVELFSFRTQVHTIQIESHFAKFWDLCGLPPENEAEAINLLFDWVKDKNSNESVLTHSLSLLNALRLKYPDLTPEFIGTIESQIGKSYKLFDKKALKILNTLKDDF
ncbi:MAG: hypothetical protein R2852_10125 [Bacteroidia bacterium]